MASKKRALEEEVHDVDAPVAIAVMDDDADGDSDVKKFQGMRKSGKVWKTRQRDP